MNNFYVYAYSDKDNVPFYIGKGSGERFYVSKHLNNKQPFLKNKIRKVGIDNIKVHFLHENLMEKEAFEFEVFYIKFYGRRDNNTGQLCNLTDGGEGTSGGFSNRLGRKHSEESKRKMSEANKGKKLSKETRQKISEAQKGENNNMYGVHREGKSNPMYGKHHSEETCQKISEAQKGENSFWYGKHHSEESKNKMSNARKLYWAKRKRKN